MSYGQARCELLEVEASVRGAGRRTPASGEDEKMTMIEWTPAKKAVAVCAAVGVGLLVVHSRRRYREHNGAPIVLDPDLDSDTRRVVLAALEREHDPAVLHTLSDKLAAAGHDKTARVVRERSISLLRIPHLVGFDYSMFPADVAVTLRAQEAARTLRAQKMLRKLGYDVPLNGVQDLQTWKAVQKFQSLHDLDIDGIIGVATYAMLRHVMEGS